MRIIGLDPGLRAAGWGVIEIAGARLHHVANGCVTSNPTMSLAERLADIHRGLGAAIADHRPDEAAVEETFVNRNAASALKLGQARGAALLAAAHAGLPVAEYAANAVKKAVTGVGHAEKAQIQAMVMRLLPGVALNGEDAADALAVAICHGHLRQSAIARAARL